MLGDSDIIRGCLASAIAAEERAALLGIVAGPVWQDACQHCQGSYVATFEVYDNDKMQVYDLYVFEQRGRSEVCLRHGDGCSEYLSPGDVGQFCHTTGHNRNDAPEYRKAYEILRSLGSFHWRKA